MINFNFPEDCSLPIESAILAFPDGFWTIPLRNSSSVKKTLVVRSSGMINEVDVWFRTISRYSGGCDRVECLGKIDQLKNAQVKFTTYKHEDNWLGSEGYVVVSENGEIVNPTKTRNNNTDDKCYASVIDPNLVIREGSAGKIVGGLLPKNPGVGFRRGEGIPIFINPDESVTWQKACLSIDELTCLVIHNKGGCIIDNPV